MKRTWFQIFTLGVLETMKHLIRLRSSSSNSIYGFLNSQLHRCRVFHLSSLSKPSKLLHSKKTQELHLEDPAQTNQSTSFFNEITEIFGASDVVPDKYPSGFSLSKEAHVRNVGFGEMKYCAQRVCEKVEENNELQKKDTSSTFTGAQMGDSNGIDVSPVVHEITAVIRAGNKAGPMEERLERLGFRFEPEIVEKVLKRCFKVPQLAFRFFSWVTTKDGFFHTTGIYNTMLYIAGEAKEFGMVENLLEEMDKNACGKNIKTWTTLISHYGKAKLIGKALLCFEKMKKSGFEPDVEAYKSLMRSLCNAGKGEIVLELYKEMVQRDMRLDLSSYKMLMKCVAELGSDDAVNLLADDMVRISQIPEHDVHVCVLKSFCMAGRIREALEFIRDLKYKDIPLDGEYLETLVKGLCRADRIEDALEIVEIMKRRHFVDGKVFGILINGYLRRKEVSKALDLFQNMKESGHQPTTFTYTEVMQHLFRLNEYHKGCQLYDEILDRGIETDNLTITTIVVAHIGQNRISEAWEVFKSMEDKGMKPTSKDYFMFIKELCKVSRTDEILKVLHTMFVSKIFVHDKIFEWVISYLKKKGAMDNIEKVKQMQKIYGVNSVDDERRGGDASLEQEVNVSSNQNQMEQRSDDNSVKLLSKDYNDQDLEEICKMLSSSSDWCIIEEALEKWTIPFEPGLVMEILRKCGMQHGSATLHFFSWLRTQAGYRHTTETYNMAIKIAGRGKDFKHMRSLFHEMRRNGCSITPNTWAIMIMQYGRTGLTDIALKTFRDMKAGGYIPTGSTYRCLILSLCGTKGRKVDNAIRIFHEMICAGHIPDTDLVETYLCCLCEVDKLVEARKCADLLSKVGYRIPHNYSLYIRALCRAGRLEEALSLLDEVQEERSTLDRDTYASIVHGLLRKGRVEEALAKVNSMNQSGICPNVHVHTSLMVYFLGKNQPKRALEIFAKMRQEGCEPTIVTYSALIRGFMNTGRAADAWNVFHHLKMNGPRPDFRTYSMFIDCLCREGKSEEALQLLSEMLDDGIAPSTVNFRTIFFGLNREGKTNLAQAVMQQKLCLMRKRKFLT